MILDMHPFSPNFLVSRSAMPHKHPNIESRPTSKIQCISKSSICFAWLNTNWTWIASLADLVSKNTVGFQVWDWSPKLVKQHWSISFPNHIIDRGSFSWIRRDMLHKSAAKNGLCRSTGVLDRRSCCWHWGHFDGKRWSTASFVFELLLEIWSRYLRP